jgi:hypothetical protein
MNARDFVDAAIKYEHHGISMPRFAAFIIGVCLSASAIARADTPPDSDQEARYDLFVRTGNQARLAGRHKDAATAYKLALDIHRHPVISGRFGLALMKLGQIDRAAEELHFAMEQGQGVELYERREVAAAYDKAKTSTTWVTVIISHTGAKVTCDDVSWNRGGHSSFWRFAMPGEHTVRAQLDGFEDAVETFTAKPGEKITISLTLTPSGRSKLPELPETMANENEARTFPPYLRTSNIAGDSNYDPREDPSYGEPKDAKPAKKKSGPRFSINGGVVTVFGVASWNPAVGGVVGVGLRPKEFISLGIEGRAAWLTTDVVSGSQITAMTGGGIASACGHLKWFFGCGLGHVGAMNVAFSERSYTGKSYTDARLGIGGRLGAQFHVTESVIVNGSIDALKLSSGAQIFVGNQLLVDIPPLFVSGQITGGWEF